MKVFQKQMQKAVNVNNKIVIIVMIVFSCGIYAQQLEGKYCLDRNGDITENCVYFSKNQKFVYKGGIKCGDLGYDFGFGKYSINENQLTLKFNESEFNYPHYYNTEKIKHDKDSISVNFKVFDMESKNMPFDIMIDDGKAQTSYAKDKNSKKKFEESLNYSFEKSIFPIKVSIFFIGYQSTTFYFVPDADYNFKVYLRDTYYCNVNSEVWNYDIVKKNNDTLLKGKDQIWRKVKSELVD